MDDFEALHKLKINTQRALEEVGYTYHGGSLLGDEMEAILYVSKEGREFKVVINIDK